LDGIKAKGKTISPLVANYPILTKQSVYAIKKNIPVMASKGGAWTDGKSIYLPEDVSYFSHPAYKSLALRAMHGHETAHTAYDSYSLGDAYMDWLLEQKKIRYKNIRVDAEAEWYHKIHNIIEDVRIEYLYGKTHRGMGAWFKFHNETLLWFRPKKHGGTQKKPSIEDQAKAVRIDPGPHYLMEEFAQLAIIGRTLEPVEPEHRALMNEIMEKVNEYKTLEPPMDVNLKIDMEHPDAQRLLELSKEIAELLESKYPRDQMQKAADQQQGGGYDTQQQTGQTEKQPVSPRNPINNPNNVPKGETADKEAEKVKSGKLSGQSTVGQGRKGGYVCPQCGVQLKQVRGS
jgi:hypothetical protein